jgi:hypothetical protein
MSLTKAALLFADFPQTDVREFFLYIPYCLSLISPGGNYKYKGGGGRGALSAVLRVNDPKEMGARSARACSVVQCSV